MVRGLLCVEAPEANHLPIQANTRHPLVLPCGEVRTKLAVLGVPVLLVKCVGGFSEICKSIVSGLPVDMVNVVRRPFAINVKPHKPVSLVLLAVYHYLNVALFIKAVKHIANPALAAIRYSGKYASGFVVVEKFAQTIYAKIASSHAVVPLKQWFGQKPRRVLSTSGLRHFILGLPPIATGFFSFKEGL
jgi:hypothetical protein